MENYCRDNCHDDCTYCACACHRLDWHDDGWSDNDDSGDLAAMTDTSLAVGERVPTPFPSSSPGECMLTTSDESEDDDAVPTIMEEPCTPDRPTVAVNTSPHHRQAKRAAQRLFGGGDEGVSTVPVFHLVC